MIKFYARPYNICAEGFFFCSYDEYEEQSALFKYHGELQVEEFELQFIDGEDIDFAFAKALGVNQSNIDKFFELVDEWDDHQKTVFIIAIGECGYAFNPETDNIDDLDVQLYEVETLEDLAKQFVDEGLFGDVPERFQFYIDYEAVARDLSVDYSMIEIAGNRLAYRCA